MNSQIQLLKQYSQKCQANNAVYELMKNKKQRSTQVGLNLKSGRCYFLGTKITNYLAATPDNLLLLALSYLFDTLHVTGLSLVPHCERLR